MVFSALAFAQCEVIWYFQHVGIAPSKSKAARMVPVDIVSHVFVLVRSVNIILIQVLNLLTAWYVLDFHFYDLDCRILVIQLLGSY